MWKEEDESELRARSGFGFSILLTIIISIIIYSIITSNGKENRVNQERAVIETSK